VSGERARAPDIMQAQAPARRFFRKRRPRPHVLCE
jgi:hypothetical protein